MRFGSAGPTRSYTAVVHDQPPAEATNGDVGGQLIIETVDREIPELWWEVVLSYSNWDI